MDSTCKRLWVFFTILATAVTANATTVRRVSFDEACSRSAAIVRARVDRTEASFPADSFARTNVTVTVLETYKGGSVAHLTFAVPGARTARTWVRVSGAPQFGVGEEVVLFLYRTPKGEFVCFGLWQAVCRVDRSSITPRLIGTHAAGREALADFGTRVRANVTRLASGK